MDITGFTFENISVNFACEGVEIADDYSSVETSKANMTQLCIQWLALNDPDSLAEGK